MYIITEVNSWITQLEIKVMLLMPNDGSAYKEIMNDFKIKYRKTVKTFPGQVPLLDLQKTEDCSTTGLLFNYQWDWKKLPLPEN